MIVKKTLKDFNKCKLHTFSTMLSIFIPAFINGKID